jgi:hypothetical protein
MSKLQNTLLALLVGGSILCCAQAALAAEPATVTVRVEGTNETLLAPTVVTTTGAPVVKDGNSADYCPGTNAVGALDIATAGNWSGSWYETPSETSPAGEYAVETILGESHLFTGPTYWEFWIDNTPSNLGVCSKTIHTGATLLFFPGCYGAECPPPSNPLGVQAPPAALLGERVSVTVTSYENGTGAPSPAAGATVSYEGKTVETDAAGHATIELGALGSHQVTVTKPLSIRTEATICVHVAADGGCGTAGGSSPAPGGSVAGFNAATAPYKGPFALVAHVSSIANGRHYRRGAVPRLISGAISSHSAVTSVSLSLRRSWHGICSAYDAERARFVRSRCGTAPSFAVAKEASFSYLLPKTLAPGRYVLDVRASDVAGNTLSLARGTSRVVFYVR